MMLSDYPTEPRRKARTWYIADEATIEALAPREKAYDAFFRDPSGFHVRVAPDGRKTFAMRYKQGKTNHRYTIGVYGVWSVQQAIAKAEDLRRQVDDDTAPSPHETRKGHEGASRVVARVAPAPRFLCVSVKHASVDDLMALRAMHLRAAEMYDEFIAARVATMGAA